MADLLKGNNELTEPETPSLFPEVITTAIDAAQFVGAHQIRQRF
jgi:hypothetical protein